MSRLCLRVAVVVLAGLAFWGGSRPGAAQEKPSAAELQAEWFNVFGPNHIAPTEEELRKVLSEVPGKNYRFGRQKKGPREFTRIDGFYRLNLPWPEGSALRMCMIERERFQVHVYHGQEGITLRYFRDEEQSWAVYHTTRDAGKPEPKEPVLWATDQWRTIRTDNGTVCLHYAAGALTMARGGVRLFTVPFSGPPDEVFVEGSALVWGLDVAEGPPLPPEATTGEEVLPRTPAARLAWREEPVAGCSLTHEPDGSVLFAAAEKTDHVFTDAWVCEPGLHEFLFEVESPDPGTGIYLGNSAGEPLFRLAFFREPNTRRTTFGLMYPHSREIERNYEYDKRAVPYVGRRHWLRMVLAGGVLSVWTSGDGRHWSQPEHAIVRVEGSCTRLGLYACSDEKPRAIRLHSVEIRRLARVESLADSALRGAVPRLADCPDLGIWTERVETAQPGNADPAAWRRTCIVGTLQQGPKPEVGQPLLGELLTEAIAGAGESDALALLHEAGLLVNIPDQNDLLRYLGCYDALGTRWMRGDHPCPYTTIDLAVARALPYVPGWLIQVPEQRLRHELVLGAYQGRWADVAALCNRLEERGLYRRLRESEPTWMPSVGHLVEWAEGEAARNLGLPESETRWAAQGRPGGRGRRLPASLAHSGAHPLLQRVDKEGYNVLAEVLAAKQSETWREAAQLVTSAAPAAIEGLVFSPDDAERMVSLRLALEQCVLGTPALRETLETEFGQLGQLRFTRACDTGNPREVEVVAAQFPGTSAAASAYQWLGDRALAAGWFARAGGYYQSAQRSQVSPSEELAARVRLAAALEGRDAGSAVQREVHLAGQTLAAADFERLVAEMRQARAASSAVAAPEPYQPPAAGAYALRPWAGFDRNHERRPAGVSHVADWVARQTGVVFAAGQMIVSSPVEVIGLELASGRPLWQQKLQVDEARLRWPMARMQPLALGAWIFVRRLTEQGPELACLDVVDGRLLWNQRPEKGHVASDPLCVGQAVCAVTASTLQNKLRLELTGYHPESGGILASRPLVEFTDFWNQEIPCAASVAGDRIVISAGGAAICCDGDGALQWVRRQMRIPSPPYDRSNGQMWSRQLHDPPVIAGQRVLVTQPGVWTVDCIDLTTGRLLWSEVEPDVRRVVGVAGDLAIIETSDAIGALDLATGEPRWYHTAPNRFEVCQAGAASVVYAQRQPMLEPRDQFRGRLVWLNPATGKAVHQSELPLTPDKQPLAGPLVVRGRRAWLFVSGEATKTRRELLELAPR